MTKRSSGRPSVKRAVARPTLSRKTRRTPKTHVLRGRQGVEAVTVTSRELEQLRRELERRMRTPRRSVRAAEAGKPMRWNPDPDDVHRSVAQLVLTIVEFLRQLMERQAI